jgi:phosphoglucosamine mutase
MDVLFGTDGIRSRVGKHPVTPQSFLQLGWALGSWIGSGRVLIGKDTRLSGYMLESALQAGLSAAGIDVYLTGPLPTPAVAYLTQSLNAQAGLVISASHNPFHDNGLKIFSSSGLKLTAEQQEEISLWYNKKLIVVGPNQLGKAHRLHDAGGRYIEFLKRYYPSLSLAGVSIMLDCANGAAYQIAPQIFRELKADVHVIHDQPDGYNINHDSGVIHPGKLESLIKKHQPKFAFAFDGDADRLAVYIDGEKLDPNHVLLTLYDYYQSKQLPDTGVVTTCLSNLGLERYLLDHNIQFVSTDVGDKNLIYAGLAHGWMIAGEPSGHYLLMDKLKTADPLLVALALIDYFMQTGKSAKYYQEKAPLYPALSHDFPSIEPRLLLAIPEVALRLNLLKESYQDIKIIVRPSGTESVIRLYVEGQVLSILEELMQELINMLTEHQHLISGMANEKVVAA